MDGGVDWVVKENRPRFWEKSSSKHKNWVHKDKFRSNFYVNPGESLVNFKEQRKMKQDYKEKLKNTLQKLLI